VFILTFSQSSLGVVLGGIVFQNSMSKRGKLLAETDLPKDILLKLSGTNAAANVHIVATIQDPKLQLIVRQAFAWSTRNIWIFYTCVAVVGVVASAFVKTSTLSAEHVETKTGLRTKNDAGIGEETRDSAIVIN
jgi:hypothetical protein